MTETKDIYPVQITEEHCEFECGQCGIMKDGKVWHLFYQAYGTGLNGMNQIGLATGTSLYNLVPALEQPIIKNNAGDPSPARLKGRTVLFFEQQAKNIPGTTIKKATNHLEEQDDR